MRNEDVFVQLVRLGIEHRAERITDEIEWNIVEALAERQGLSAIVVDAVDSLPTTNRPPQEKLLQWIGESIQDYEYRYELYCRAIAELAAFYHEHGCKMMVLKGYACSRDWPIPKHRPCGDIDIWQFGQQKEADALITKEKGIQIDNSHHHHTVFRWHDFMVENHYDFINVYHHKSNSELEIIFKEQGADDSHYVELYGEKVYLPSSNLHALFLLRHSMVDFAACELSLRQVLDWAFFVNAHGKEVDWKWLLQVLDKFNMRNFFNCLNAICVEDLGFDQNVFPYIQFEPQMKNRVFKEIMSPSFSREEPQGFIPRVIYKYRRWKGSEWKHRLCYNESMWSAFRSGVWNHLLKPASI